jgi:hypothetical protein
VVVTETTVETVVDTVVETTVEVTAAEIVGKKYEAAFKPLFLWNLVSCEYFSK